MGSPQQHPGSGMLPWMRQLGADPPSLHLPLLPHLDVASSFSASPEPAKKRTHLEDLIREMEESEAARKQEATEREERRWREMEEKEEQREKKTRAIR